MAGIGWEGIVPRLWWFGVDLLSVVNEKVGCLYHERGWSGEGGSKALVGSTQVRGRQATLIDRQTGRGRACQGVGGDLLHGWAPFPQSRGMATFRGPIAR